MSVDCKIGSRPLDQSFDEYARQQRELGYTDVLERQWAPLAVATEHIHEFAASALIVQGAMWLCVGTETHQLSPGSTFELSANVLHAERYGSDGATYWVARRPG
jgi:AraC-like ligand binding domain